MSVTLKPCPRAFRIREQSANQIIQIIAGRPPSIALPFPFPSTIGFAAALIRPNFFFFFFTSFELLFSMIERSVARFVKEPMWRNNKSSIKNRIPAARGGKIENLYRARGSDFRREEPSLRHLSTLARPRNGPIKHYAGRIWVTSREPRFFISRIILNDSLQSSPRWERPHGWRFHSSSLSSSVHR